MITLFALLALLSMPLLLLCVLFNFSIWELSWLEVLEELIAGHA